MRGFESVTIWLNAFLPRDILGRTTTLREGPWAGKTALVGPAYRLTDQRGFSPDRRASSRMHSCVTVDFTGSTPVLSQLHRCDPTIVGETGAAAARRARASTRRMIAVTSALAPRVVVRLDAVASDPLPTRTPRASDVAYRGDIVVDRERRIVSVELLVQLFPAFEGYASIEGGPPAILFHHAPPPGVEPAMPTSPQRRIHCALHDWDGDGVFDGPVPREPTRRPGERIRAGDPVGRNPESR